MPQILWNCFCSLCFVFPKPRHVYGFVGSVFILIFFLLWPNSFQRFLVSSWPSISFSYGTIFVPDFPLFSESISDSTGRYLFTRSLTQLIAQISMLMFQELGANVLSPNWLAPGRAQRGERLRMGRLGSVVSSTLSLKTSVLGINKCP